MNDLAEADIDAEYQSQISALKAQRKQIDEHHYSQAQLKAMQNQQAWYIHQLPNYTDASITFIAKNPKGGATDAFFVKIAVPAYVRKLTAVRPTANDKRFGIIEIVQVPGHMFNSEPEPDGEEYAEYVGDNAGMAGMRDAATNFAANVGGPFTPADPYESILNGTPAGVGYAPSYLTKKHKPLGERLATAKKQKSKYSQKLEKSTEKVAKLEKQIRQKRAQTAGKRVVKAQVAQVKAQAKCLSKCAKAKNPATCAKKCVTPAKKGKR